VGLYAYHGDELQRTGCNDGGGGDMGNTQAPRRRREEGH